MKTIKLFSFVLIACCITATSFAQKTQKETIKVSGECGMCKKKIEKAALASGATYAVWNVDTKMLTVKYNSSATNLAKIQQSVANSGYDTQDVKTTEEVYSKLDDCCKYEREKTEIMDCCKDGKCTMEGHDGKDCCKGEKGEKGDKGEKGSKSMDCCKDGKCAKEGNTGKDCCKKS